MKKLLLLIIAAAVGWAFYSNWDDLTGTRATKDDYVMKGYKKSIDKARQVEDTLQQAKDRLDQAQPK
jgi:hypothetical protein